MNKLESALEIVRPFDAPRESIWRAWTVPEELAKWWWPERFETTYQVDLRAGGTYRFSTIDLPPMGVLAVTGTFLEVRPSERLVYTWRWENSAECQTRVSVDFVDAVGQSEIRLRHEDLESREVRENHIAGWANCLDRLQTLVGTGDA